MDVFALREDICKISQETICASQGKAIPTIYFLQQYGKNIPTKLHFSGLLPFILLVLTPQPT